VTADRFARELAWARTFGFVREVEPLRARGLIKGASTQNAVVLDDAGVVENTLRSPDEFVRHKILDIIGDLSLVGLPVIGHVVAHKSGHSLNSVMVSKLLQSPSNWVLLGASERTAARREQAVFQESAAM